MAALAITCVWIFFRTLPAGPSNLSIPETPLPVSLFGDVGSSIFPSSDFLLAFLFPILFVGIRKSLVSNEEEAMYRDPEHYDPDDIDDFGIASLFGVAFLLVAVFIKWASTFVLDENKAEIIAFVAIPVIVVVVYIVSEYMPIEMEDGKKIRTIISAKVLIAEVVGFLVGFYSVLIFFSALFRGWFFPWALAIVWSFQEFVFPYLSRLARKIIFLYRIKKFIGRPKTPLKLA